MIDKVEGILLNKIPFKDRHLIGRLLLRNGTILSILFFGGRGGGAKKKTSLLEVGHLLQVQLARAKSGTQLIAAKEWVLKWQHQSIRYHYKSFNLMALYSELIGRLAVETSALDLSEKDATQGEGLFILLSNALFYLEKDSSDKKTNLKRHLNYFLGKLLFHLGIYPERTQCALCGLPLGFENDIALSFTHGGFVLRSEVERVEEYNFTLGQDLCAFLGFLSHSPYRLVLLEGLDKSDVADILFSYLCYQLSLNRNDFKSYFSTI